MKNYSKVIIGLVIAVVLTSCSNNKVAQKNQIAEAISHLGEGEIDIQVSRYGTNVEVLSISSADLRQVFNESNITVVNNDVKYAEDKYIIFRSQSYEVEIGLFAEKVFSYNRVFFTLNSIKSENFKMLLQ